MTAAEVTPLLGDWAYGAMIVAPIGVGAVVHYRGRRIGAAIERAIARWDAWCQAPNPTPIQRRRRPPTPRGTR